VLLSREMQTEFSRRVGASQTNENGDRQTEFIYSAVDAARFSPVDEQSRLRLRQQLGIPDDCFAIGCVAELAQRKAQLEFIKEGVPLLSQLLPNAKVYFVGDFAPEKNEYARSCHDAVRDLGLREVVSFTGHAENVADWYRALDLMVVTSRNEGLARCMIESLACGTPVVSFEVCSAREILESHECGSVVPNGNYEDLARQTTLLATQANTRARMAANGVAAVRQLFNPEAVSAQYERLYSTLRAN
jgi:glycosyltransferase involved in cell wall biosynthesis